MPVFRHARHVQMRAPSPPPSAGHRRTATNRGEWIDRLARTDETYRPACSRWCQTFERAPSATHAPTVVPGPRSVSAPVLHSPLPNRLQCAGTTLNRRPSVLRMAKGPRWDWWETRRSLTESWLQLSVTILLSSAICTGTDDSADQADNTQRPVTAAAERAGIKSTRGWIAIAVL